MTQASPSTRYDRVLTAEHLRCEGFSLPSLPWTVHVASAPLTLDTFRDTDGPEAVALTRRAVAEGVCEEGLGTAEGLGEHMALSPVFTLRCAATARLRHVLVVKPNLFSRTFLTTCPVLTMVGSRGCVTTSRDGVPESHDGESTEDEWRDLLAIGTRVVAEVERGYTGCLVLLLPGCEGLRRALRSEGFLCVATVPRACRVAGRRGLQEYYLYYRHLGGHTMKMPEKGKMVEIIERVLCEGSGRWEEGRLRPVPYLPLMHRTAGGHHIRLRNADKADAAAIFDLFSAASRQGRGYGADEMLSFRFFQQSVLLDAHVVAVEPAAGGDVAGYIIIRDSDYARTPDTGLCDPFCVLRPAYTGRGLGGELLGALIGMARDLGYTGLLTDTVASNHPALSNFRSNKMVITGVLPDHVLLEDGEFYDVTLAYLDISRHPSFFNDVINTLDSTYKSSL